MSEYLSTLTIPPICKQHSSLTRLKGSKLFSADSKLQYEMCVISTAEKTLMFYTRRCLHEAPNKSKVPAAHDYQVVLSPATAVPSLCESCDAYRLLLELIMAKKLESFISFGRRDSFFGASQLLEDFLYGYSFLRNEYFCYTENNWPFDSQETPLRRPSK